MQALLLVQRRSSQGRFFHEKYRAPRKWDRDPSPRKGDRDLSTRKTLQNLGPRNEDWDLGHVLVEPVGGNSAPKGAQGAHVELVGGQIRPQRGPGVPTGEK